MRSIFSLTCNRRNWNKNIIAFTVFAVLTIINVYGQNIFHKDIPLRPGSVSYQDSLVKFNSIATDEIKVRLSDKKNYYWFESNKIHSNYGGYSGYLLQGGYKVYNNNKGLITQGQYSKGLKTGTWKQWNHKGELIVLEKYKQGFLHGKALYFTHKDSLPLELKYKKGNIVRKEEKALEADTISISNPEKEIELEPETEKNKRPKRNNSKDTNISNGTNSNNIPPIEEDKTPFWKLRKKEKVKDDEES